MVFSTGWKTSIACFAVIVVFFPASVLMMSTQQYGQVKEHRWWTNPVVDRQKP
jgi:hypothetical protein